MCWLQVLASTKERKSSNVLIASFSVNERTSQVMCWLQVLASMKERKSSNVLIASFSVNERTKVK